MARPWGLGSGADREGCKGGVRSWGLQVVFEALEIYPQGKIGNVGDVTHPCRESARLRRGWVRDAARASLGNPPLYAAATGSL